MTNQDDAVAESGGPGVEQATANETVDVSFFDEAYRGTGAGWDIGKPRPFFAPLVDAGTISGSVLDIGCGTGSDSVYFASRGLEVTGLDGSGVAIERARAKAREQGVSARFIQGDALRLSELNETFDTVVECGLLHVFSDENMARLVREVHAVLRPSGRYVVACFSDQASFDGPRKLSQQQLETLFADGWEIESMERITLTAAPSYVESLEADEGPGAAAWLVVLQRP